jgi:hypothetical protein
MTNSDARVRAGKRERLVASAADLLHRQGVLATALAHSWADMREVVAQHGCPFGTLCVELDNREDGLRDAAAGLMALFIDWAREQFAELGRSDARDLAVTLLATVQGAALLTNTLRDPDILTAQVHHVEKWIDSLT